MKGRDRREKESPRATIQNQMERRETVKTEWFRVSEEVSVTHLKDPFGPWFKGPVLTDKRARLWADCFLFLVA